MYVCHTLNMHMHAIFCASATRAVAVHIHAYTRTHAPAPEACAIVTWQVQCPPVPLSLKNWGACTPPRFRRLWIVSEPHQLYVLPLYYQRVGIACNNNKHACVTPPYHFYCVGLRILLLLNAIISCLHTFVIHLFSSMNSELRTLYISCVWSYHNQLSLRIIRVIFYNLNARLHVKKRVFLLWKLKGKGMMLCNNNRILSYTL